MSLAKLYLALIWIVLASINYKLGKIARAQERLANYAALEAAVELDINTVPFAKGRLSFPISKN